jgi:RNA polymerase sigma-70 factor, ECF subfamily
LAEGDHKGAGGTAADRRLAELFREQAEFVWRVVQRMGVPRAEAEDAVQEVFLVVAKRIDSYEERGALRAWLVAIARQVAQHAQRARFRRERKERELGPLPAASDPHRLLEQSEAVAFVQEFLASLDENHALVFYLAEIEGMSAPEIAASLGCNLNTVYARLRTARQRFEARAHRSMGMERRTR